MASLLFMASGHGMVGSGTSAATPTAVTVTCGFKPKFVKVLVIDTLCKETQWQEGMDAGKGVQLRDNTGYKLEELATDGITVTENGFTIGTAAQTASKVYYWLALT